jgi:hypothetical protein
MLPPPPVLAPPAGAADALTAALDDTSGDGAGLEAAGLDGAGLDAGGLDAGGLDGAGLDAGGLDDVGVGVGLQVLVGVGVGVGVWLPDGDGVPPPGCPLTPAAETPVAAWAADLGVACAAVAPSSNATTPRAKQPARIRMRMGMYVTLLIARSQ